MERKKYKRITKKQQAQIKALFYVGSYKTTFDFEIHKDGYYICIDREYDYIEFDKMDSIQGCLKIAEILGCEHGQECSRNRVYGCPTCDSDSEYTIDFHFW